MARRRSAASLAATGGNAAAPANQSAGGGLAGVLEQLRGSLGGSTPGGLLSGGLGS